tara:strand:+ start:183 stop:677 length:495 start_codon:yes stop_codon:yes gene_type:complete
MLNQETLKKYLNYDPETGVFAWKVPTSNRVSVGSIAGTSHSPGGYVSIGLFGKLYKAHRLAMLYVHGESPKNDTDHINGIKNDNRINNLRAVTRTENLKNKALNKNNTSGTVGVFWNKKQQAWKVVIGETYCGIFKSKLDAVAKAKSVYKELGYHENHGRIISV